MKKIIFILALSSSVMFYFGCKSENKSDNHNHDNEHVHGESCTHDHDHDHAKEGGDAHSHSEENHNPNNIEMTPEQAKSVGLETLKIQSVEFSQVIKAGGKIISAQGDEKTISANISGIVVFNRKSLTEGTAVKAGETLVSISTKNIADGDIVARTRNAYQIAKKEMERAEALMQDMLISQKEYNEIKLAYENAAAAYQAFENNSSNAGASIRTPMGGYVKTCYVTEGQYVEVGQPLLIVTQNQKLQLQAEVSEKFYGSLSTIKSANFKTSYDNRLYELDKMNGRVVSYGKSANANSFLIPINFEFDNVGDIVSGSYVEVYLLGQKMENKIVIPITALIEEQGVFYAFVKLDDYHYTRKEVSIGASDGQNVEVVSGLSIGDNVVSKGAYHVKLASLSAAIPHGHSH